MHFQATDDQRIAQFIAGEMSAEEVVAFRQDVEANAALEAELRVMLDLRDSLVEELSLPTSELPRPTQDEILRTARQFDRGRNYQSPRIEAARIGKKSWIYAGTGIAASVALVLGWMNSIHVKPSGTGRESATVLKPVAAKNYDFEVSLTPVQGPPHRNEQAQTKVETASPELGALVKADSIRNQQIIDHGSVYLDQLATSISKGPIPKESELLELDHRSKVLVADQRSIALPMQSGVSSMIWVTRMIHEHQKLPSADAVRLEEMLNHFAIRPEGLTSLCQGVSVSTELMSCPWRPSAVLLLVSFRGHPTEVRDIKASYVADAQHVYAYRLLGYAPVKNLDGRPMPTQLPPGMSTTLAIEIDPNGPEQGLGQIEWTVGGQNGVPLDIKYQPDNEPSNDARFAALVCAYSDWLVRKEESGLDKTILSAMIREIQSSCTTEDRIQFLKTVEMSIRL